MATVDGKAWARGVTLVPGLPVHMVAPTSPEQEDINPYLDFRTSTTDNQYAPRKDMMSRGKWSAHLNDVLRNMQLTHTIWGDGIPTRQEFIEMNPTLDLDTQWEMFSRITSDHLRDNAELYRVIINQVSLTKEEHETVYYNFAHHKWADGRGLYKWIIDLSMSAPYQQKLKLALSNQRLDKHATLAELEHHLNNHLEKWAQIQGNNESDPSEWYTALLLSMPTTPFTSKMAQLRVWLGAKLAKGMTLGGSVHGALMPPRELIRALMRVAADYGVSEHSKTQLAMM